MRIESIVRRGEQWVFNIRLFGSEFSRCVFFSSLIYYHIVFYSFLLFEFRIIPFYFGYCEWLLWFKNLKKKNKKQKLGSWHLTHVLHLTRDIFLFPLLLFMHMHFNYCYYCVGQYLKFISKGFEFDYWKSETNMKRKPRNRTLAIHSRFPICSSFFYQLSITHYHVIMFQLFKSIETFMNIYFHYLLMNTWFRWNVIISLFKKNQ